ncbi:hypothetical protein B0I35DRAFT_220807 [Stachybotrys elegans]|uniref:Uncharacterized protein n=1 Tax=Stachybotrys elegans TaxID=80388 RepID=A0A8K0SXK4_9HYPO|nr:hypothetical protein B0I35DRAFT_220807 [Stachybotrys elegans]
MLSCARAASVPHQLRTSPVAGCYHCQDSTSCLTVKCCRIDSLGIGFEFLGPLRPSCHYGIPAIARRYSDSLLIDASVADSNCPCDSPLRTPAFITC